MSAWIIYDKNGLAKCEARRLEYSGEFLGACSVSVNITSPTPIGFELGDWLEYRGERFELNYDPSVVKESFSDTYGEGFQYENIVFNSLADELTRCDFLDYVPKDNELHYSSLPTFSFFADSITKLADRIQANLDRVYTDDKKWTVEVHPEYVNTLNVNITASNNTVWDALGFVNSKFGANFIIRGRKITIGTTGLAVGQLFSYGKGNGLYKIERNAESNQKVITRLRAYGSTRNMPTDYYHNVSGGNVPNNMAVRNLMLPSFPVQTHDPYIDSKNIEELGIREGTVFFDGSSELEEIYPTMEGMTAEGLKEAGVNVSATGDLDVIVTAEQMTDNGIIPEGGELKGNFKVTLKDIGFDINEHLSALGSATLSMKSGMCSGREFEIEACVKTGNGYELTCKRAEDSGLGLVFPYKDFQIKANDKFVLLNIDMPDVYIKAASHRLLTAAKAYLAKNDYVRYSYTPTLDNIFLARQHDEAVANGGVSIHDTIKEGDFILFEDEDLGISGSVTIDSLSIKEDYSESIIPEYSLTLRNEKSVGTIEKIQNQVTSILNGVSGGSVNTEQVKSIVEAVGNVRFLSKIKDDRSKGVIASDKGFEAGRFVSGFLGGTGAWIGADGFAEMTGLTLREFLQVPEYRNNRVDVVSGELWNSIAFGLVEKVNEDEQKCWIKLEDNELCGLHIGDFCRGIFADFEDGIKSEGIDKNNFIQLYGFKTSYFKPIEILENKEGSFVFKYELCPGTDVHPCASMKFSVYGNEIDPSRRASAYSTRTYKRYLNNVDTWEIDPDKHIYAQYGDLTGLTIGGVEMKGYGSFQSNAYFRGVQIQLPPEQLEELRGESAYSVMLSSSNDVVTVDADGNMGNVYEKLNVVTNGENVVTNGKNVVTSVFKLKTDVQVRKGSKALYYSTFDAADSYTLSIEPVGCEAVVMNGIIIISNVLNQNNCYVNINVTCEGKATFRLIYRVTFVKDGKVGKDSLSYRITPNIATLGKTMTGSIDPESITFKLYKNQGEQSTLFPGLWVLQGRNSSDEDWEFVRSSNFQTETWTCLFSGGWKYYRVQATGSGNSLYDEKEITVVADGKSGSMARYRGEFEFYNDSEPYVYNGEYRDVVLYEGNVYQVYAYGSSVTDAPSVSANSDNDGKWQRANQFRFVAMDTALIDNANIAGFTFRRKKYINNSPVGVMRSQYGPICISSVSQDFVSGNEIGITINGAYTKYIKIRKFNQTAYELVPSIETIVRRKNSSGEWVYDVSSISCSIKKITEGGSTIVSSVSGYTLKYAKDSGIETSGSSVSTSGATSNITFILYDSKNVEVERQSIPVLSEGDTSVKAVVDNDTVILLVNDNNEVIYGMPHRFKATLWKGINEVSITNISFSNTSNVEISNEYIEIDTESGAFKCTNAYITGEVNANEGTFRNVEIKNATMKNGLLEAELSSNAVDGYPGISWMYDKTEYARLGMWVVNGQVSGVLKISNNSAWKESSILRPGMLVLAGKKSGFTSNFETLLSYDGVIFRTENSSYSSGMLVDYAGCLVINSDYWPAESYVADGAVYVDKSGYLKVKNPNRIEI